MMAVSSLGYEGYSQSLTLVEPQNFEDASSSTSDESSLSDWETDGQVQQEVETPAKVSALLHCWMSSWQAAIFFLLSHFSAHLNHLAHVATFMLST